MKTTKHFLLFLSLIFAFNSCNILDDEAPDFSCDKNAPIQLNGKELCAFAKSKVVAGRLQIGFSYSTGSLDLLINVSQLEENVTYKYSDGDVSIWFNNLNKTNSGVFLITKLDKVNRKMSGQFNFDAESNNNSQGFSYIVGGKFTDVSY